MSQTVIRPMVRSDLSHISNIVDQTELFPSSMLEAMAAPFLDGIALHFWLTAEINGIIVGFAYCEPERMTHGTYNLVAIAVSPAFQHQGVGRALVEATQQTVESNGGRVLLVETSSLEEFVRTRSFYQALGFVHEAQIRDFYAEGDDKIVFWKKLGGAN